MDNATESRRTDSRSAAAVAFGWVLAGVAAGANVLTALGVLIGSVIAGPVENPETSVSGYVLFALAKLTIAGLPLGLGYLSMRLARAGRLLPAAALWAMLAAMAVAFTVTPAVLLWLPTM